MHTLIKENEAIGQEQVFNRFRKVTGTGLQIVSLCFGLVSFLFKSFTDINPSESISSLQTSVNVVSDCTIAKRWKALDYDFPVGNANKSESNLHV